MSLVLWCVLVGCGSPQTPAPVVDTRSPPPPPTSTVAAAPVDAAVLAPVEAPPEVVPEVAPVDVKASAAAALAKLSPAEAKLSQSYGKLLGALAKCKPTSFGDFDKDCKETKPLEKPHLDHYHDPRWPDVKRAAYWMHAETPSALLRMYLLEQAVGQHGDPDLASVLLDRGGEGRDVERLLGIIYQGYHQVSGALVKSLTARTTHADNEVRRMALWSLAAFGPVPPGVHTTLVNAIDHDASEYVRAEACKAAGWSGDDRMLAVYDRLLVSATNLRLLDACAEGLAAMWTHRPPGNPAAFKRTLALFAKGRRDTPLRALWSSLAFWAENRNQPGMPPRSPWLDEAELRAALEAVMKNRSVHSAARIGAAFVFTRLATPDQIRAAQAKLSEEDDEDPARCLELELERKGCKYYFDHH